MKRIKNLIIRIVCVLLVSAFALCSMAACTDENKDKNNENKGNKGKNTVTFDYNYDGAAKAEIIEITNGDVAEEPSEPTRDRYKFKGWYTDAAGTKAFDFEEALYENVTLYAKWEMTHALITFDNNYPGAPAATEQKVKLGESATQPVTPERSEYIFTGWYKQSACTDVYEFSAVVNGDMMIYAGWEQDTGDNVSLIYMWNYEGAPNGGIANKDTIKTNSKVKTVYAAERKDYYLGGWYTDAACTQEFDFTKRVAKSVTLYAKWLNIYTFEAEYVDYSGMIGNGYSGNQSGVGLIVKQKAENQQASNGHYAGWMYRNGNTLTFTIRSDRAVTDAVLVLRLSAEFYNMTLTSDKYLVQVNGNNLSYSDIVIAGVPEQGTNEWRPFSNYTVSTSVNLVEGENTIKLIINNEDRLGQSGTMYSTAPLTDCIYIYTDAELDWDPIVGNLEGNIS